MKNSLYILAACLLFASCSKKVDVSAPSLTITLDPTHLVADTFNYKVGDTVKFVMTGTAGNILFYSGETGHMYANANRTIAAGIPQLSFTSNETSGAQTNTLKVLATDKLAKVDSSHIVAANWTDITSRAVLSTGSGAVSSGIINLSDIISGPSDSLFIAYKYIGTTGSAQRTWTITNLTVNDFLPDGTSLPLITLASDVSYWNYFNIAPSTAKWAPSATQLQVTGGTATAPNNTSWIVSRPIYVDQVTPDLPVVIKQLASEIPKYTIAGKTYSGYNYKYVNAGLYTVTLVVFNNSIDEQKTVVKQFFIRVK